MILSTRCIIRDPPSPNSSPVHPTSVTQNIQEGPSGGPFPIVSWSTVSRLSKAEDTAELQAIFNDDTSSGDVIHSKLRGKKNCSTLILVKTRLRKHLFGGNGVKKIKVHSSVACSEEEMERRKERQLMIREELSNEEIYDDDANSLSSIMAEIGESELLGRIFVRPDIDSFDSKEVIPESYSIAKPEPRNDDLQNAEQSFPSSFEEKVGTCQESTATTFAAECRIRQRHSSADLVRIENPASNGLATESLLKTSNLEMPPPPVLLPQSLPSIVDTVTRRTSWRLSFVSDRRSSMLRALSQEHRPPLTINAEPFTSGADPLKWPRSHGLTLPSDVLANQSDRATYLKNSQSRRLHVETETWGAVDDQSKSQLLVIPLREWQTSYQQRSRGIANFASCPQLSILKNRSRPRRNSYAGECSDCLQSSCGLSSHQYKCFTSIQTLHNASHYNTLTRSIVRARRITIDSSLVASETSSFRHREYELQVIKTRFPESTTRSGKMTPTISRFKEEFESIPPECRGKQSILPLLQLSRMARLASGRSSPVQDISRAEGSRSRFSNARPADNYRTSKPESVAVQTPRPSTREIRQGQVLLEHTAGIWQRSKDLHNSLLKKVSQGLDLRQKTYKSASSPGHISFRNPSSKIQTFQTPNVDEVNPSFTVVDTIALDSVNTQKLPTENENPGWNVKFECQAAVMGRGIPDATPSPWSSRFQGRTRSESKGNVEPSDHVFARDLTAVDANLAIIHSRNSKEDNEVEEHHDGLLIRVSKGIRSTITKLSNTKRMVQNRTIQQRRNSATAGSEIQNSEIRKFPVEVVPPVEMKVVERTLRELEKKKREIHRSDGTDGVEGQTDDFETYMVTEVSIADPRFYSDCLFTPGNYEEREASIATAPENATEMPVASNKDTNSPELSVIEKFKFESDGETPVTYIGKGIPLRKSTLDFKDELELMEKFEMERAIRSAEEAWE